MLEYYSFMLRFSLLSPSNMSLVTTSSGSSWTIYSMLPPDQLSKSSQLHNDILLVFVMLTNTSDCHNLSSFIFVRKSSSSWLAFFAKLFLFEIYNMTHLFETWISSSCLGILWYLKFLLQTLTNNFKKWSSIFLKNAKSLKISRGWVLVVFLLISSYFTGVGSYVFSPFFYIKLMTIIPINI